MKVFLKDGTLTVTDTIYLQLMRSFTDLTKITVQEALTAIQTFNTPTK